MHHQHPHHLINHIRHVQNHGVNIQECKQHVQRAAVSGKPSLDDDPLGEIRNGYAIIETRFRRDS